MTRAKREPRAMHVDDIAAQFELASYWWGEKWCPAVHRKDNGGYGIRIVRSASRNSTTESVSYDYFEIDADGLIDVAPRGHAKDFKPGRVVDIEHAVGQYATPFPGAMRITFGGIS